MRALAMFVALLIGGAALCGLINGLAWFAADYAQHPVEPSERGFWALGPGFMGLLGGSIGIAEGLAIVPAAAVLRSRPGWAAGAGAAISGGIWLLLGMGGGALAVAFAALLVLGGGLLGWGAARLLRGGASRPQRDVRAGA